MTGPAMTSPVWGHDELTCPVPASVIRRLQKHATAHPWRGDTILTCPRHLLDTTAITEPGRPTRLLYSLDHGYHASGWFANSDYEQCLHLSISHPRVESPLRIYAANDLIDQPHTGMDLDAPTDDEVRAWGFVFFREHAPKAWLEPAVGPLDPYRSPGVVHLRLYVDRDLRPFIPRGEVYDLLPFPDGSSPAKVTEGRAGADVR